MSHDSMPLVSGRRNFLKQWLAGLISAVLGVVPLGAGLRVFLDPLSRKSGQGAPVRVTTLDQLPEDGTPRKFPVFATQVDAWNTMPQTPVGAVYLRRVGREISALNVVCPHAGCFVDYRAKEGNFLCPCHDSTFNLVGVKSPSSPAPRGMDSLLVELRNENEVWVQFQNFQPGQPERIPTA